jgi:SAM-dependent methyltransferase
MTDELRSSVEDFYRNAVKDPREDLCCPVKTPEEKEMVSHIPEEVLSISYGCGSPVLSAAISEGKAVVDLGSGGGIDCFIAAKLVGSTGSVVGVDMTGEMLDKAKAANREVSKNLGYDVVRFKDGYLEELPLDDFSADIIISNCVINLSPDKAKVFSEIYRTLKDGGHFSISDVVAHGDVPREMLDDRELWGECISGALKEEEFITLCKEAGFYGLQITSRVPYRDIQGLKFSSVIIHGYKTKGNSECLHEGHYAIYNGPLSVVIDDAGQEFPVGKVIAVCASTREVLSRPPYAGLFSFIDPDGEIDKSDCCEPSPEIVTKKKDSSGCC